MCEGPWIIGEMHEEDLEPQFLPLYFLALRLKVLFHLTVQSLCAVFFLSIKAMGSIRHELGPPKLFSLSFDLGFPTATGASQYKHNPRSN